MHKTFGEYFRETMVLPDIEEEVDWKKEKYGGETSYTAKAKDGSWCQITIDKKRIGNISCSTASLPVVKTLLNFYNNYPINLKEFRIAYLDDKHKDVFKEIAKLFADALKWEFIDSPDDEFIIRKKS